MQEEQDQISDMRGDDIPIWIGFSDLTKEGTFSWEDDAEIIFENWEKDQPNNGNGGEDCVVMRKSGRWDDVDCTREEAFVCEHSVI